MTFNRLHAGLVLIFCTSVFLVSAKLCFILMTVGEQLDAADRYLILHELQDHINALTDPPLKLIKIVNRKLTDDRICC